MAVATPTDRPKSVRNHCVIKGFGGIFVLSRWFLVFSVGVGFFVIELSQISSFFSIEWLCGSKNKKTGATHIPTYLKKWWYICAKSSNHPQVGNTVYTAHTPSHHHEIHQQARERRACWDQEGGKGQTNRANQQHYMDRNSPEMEKIVLWTVLKYCHLIL